MSNINVQVAEVNDAFFNPRLADNPCVSRYNLRKADFANTMTDIYEFMGDLNVMTRAVIPGIREILAFIIVMTAGGCTALGT